MNEKKIKVRKNCILHFGPSSFCAEVSDKTFCQRARKELFGGRKRNESEGRAFTVRISGRPFPGAVAIQLKPDTPSIRASSRFSEASFLGQRLSMYVRLAYLNYIFDVDFLRDRNAALALTKIKRLYAKMEVTK